MRASKVTVVMQAYQRLRWIAKLDGDHAITNVIFAVLLRWVAEEVAADVCGEVSENLGLWLEYHASESRGSDPDQIFYDLLVIRSREYGEAVIPVPLVSGQAIAWVLRSGVCSIHARGDSVHPPNRKVLAEKELAEKLFCVNSLMSAVPIDEIEAAAMWALEKPPAWVKKPQGVVVA